MTTTKQEKVRKSYRIEPSLVEFMEVYGKSKRWTETSVIEFALEKLAESEGYSLEKQTA